MTDSGIIVLAGGRSERMGYPKLTANVLGIPLIDHVLNVTSNFPGHRSVVVLGANVELYEERAIEKNIDTVINDQWESGIASSIISGISYLEDKSKQALEEVLILLGDMPLVNTELIEYIFKSGNSNRSGIVASKYENSFGPPALFKSKYMDQLKALEGDKGAKMIIEENLEDTEFILFPRGDFDINTPEDLDRIHSL